MSTTNVYYNSWLVSDLKMTNERGAKLWYEGVVGSEIILLSLHAVPFMLWGIQIF